MRNTLVVVAIAAAAVLAVLALEPRPQRSATGAASPLGRSKAGETATKTAFIAPSSPPEAATLTPLVGGATSYVATDGHDSNDGKTVKTPFRTIQKAVDVMQPGDTCLIRGGDGPRVRRVLHRPPELRRQMKGRVR